MSMHAPDPRSRRALVFTPMETDAGLLVDAAVHAEEAGYEAVVVPEGWGLDATVVLARIAAATETIRLATGVLSIWGRTPGTLAMAASTLDEISGGRFTLGLGASTPRLAEGLHGQPFRAPAAHLARTVTAVRTLLRGDRLETDGPHAVRLSSPRPGVPILVAGLGPEATRVAVTAADAWFPAMVPLDRVDDVRARWAGEAHPDAELVTGPMVAVDGGVIPATTVVQQMIGWYLTGMGPLYARALGQLGYQVAVEALRAANPHPRPGLVAWPREADELVAQLAAVGSPGDIAATLERWDRLADIVTVAVAPGAPGDVHRAIDAGAPTMAPRVTARLEGAMIR